MNLRDYGAIIEIFQKEAKKHATPKRLKKVPMLEVRDKLKRHKPLKLAPILKEHRDLSQMKDRKLPEQTLKSYELWPEIKMLE